MKIEKKDVNENLAYPSIWRRFMGMLYESILLIGPIFLFTFLYLFFFKTQLEVSSVDSESRKNEIQILLFLIFAFYFSWSWSNSRCTLAMKTLNMRVIGKNGNSISFFTAFLRFIYAIPSVFSGLWILFILLRNDKQCPHDLLSGTKLTIKKNQ